MSEDKFIDELKSLRNFDEEIAHDRGDEVLRDALRELGWNRLADLHKELSSDWWYA